jgi:ketosteroid isomerase-like protein
MRSGVAVLSLVGLLSAASVGSAETPDALVRGVLTDFHAAASEADEKRYFGHFATDAVFLGTEATERWTVVEFREYAKPHFDAGRGWTYVATERHVLFSADAGLAWFDETLHSEKYGKLRGTGVLRRIEGSWKIAHYSMTFLVPNDIASEVVRVIRDRVVHEEP